MILKLTVKQVIILLRCYVFIYVALAYVLAMFMTMTAMYRIWMYPISHSKVMMLDIVMLMPAIAILVMLLGFGPTGRFVKGLINRIVPEGSSVSNEEEFTLYLLLYGYFRQYRDINVRLSYSLALALVRQPLVEFLSKNEIAFLFKQLIWYTNHQYTDEVLSFYQMLARKFVELGTDKHRAILKRVSTNSGFYGVDDPLIISIRESLKVRSSSNDISE